MFLNVLVCFDSFWNCIVLVSKFVILYPLRMGVEWCRWTHCAWHSMQWNTVSPSGGTAPACDSSCVAWWLQRTDPSGWQPKACNDSVRNTFILVASWQKSAWNLSWSNSHLKKVSVLVYRMISSSTWSRLLRMAFNIQDPSSSTVESPSCDLTFRLQNIRSSAFLWPLKCNTAIAQSFRIYLVPISSQRCQLSLLQRIVAMIMNMIEYAYGINGIVLKTCVI